MLDARNNDRFHSSTETGYVWLLPLLIAIGGFMLRYLYKNKEDDGDNWIKWTLKISLWFSISSIVVKYIGFIIYAYVSGSEYQFFDFMFMLLHSVSDSAIIVILLLLAYGWTVTFKNSMDFDLYVPLACMLGMVNVIMTLLNKVTDG
jgi:predicted membrane protein